MSENGLSTRMQELEQWRREQGIRPDYIGPDGEDMRSLEERMHRAYQMETEALQAADIGSIIASSFEPPHLVELERLPIEDEEKLYLLSLYEGAEWLPFTKFLNTVQEIDGAIIWYHPAFKGMPDTNGIATIKPGYYKILYKLTAKNEEGTNKIVQCSSSALAQHTRAMIKIRGWYQWAKPVNYKFLQTEQGAPFRLLEVRSAEERAKNHAK